MGLDLDSDRHSEQRGRECERRRARAWPWRSRETGRPRSSATTGTRAGAARTSTTSPPRMPGRRARRRPRSCPTPTASRTTISEAPSRSPATERSRSSGLRRRPATGAVDVFHSLRRAAWASTSTPTATLTKAGGATGDGFGATVAVSTDGTTALVTRSRRRRGARRCVHLPRLGRGSLGLELRAHRDPDQLRRPRQRRAGNRGGAFRRRSDRARRRPRRPLGTGAADVFHVSDASSWASSSTPNAILTDKALAACVVPKLKGLKLSAAKSALAAGRCQPREGHEGALEDARRRAVCSPRAASREGASPSARRST